MDMILQSIYGLNECICVADDKDKTNKNIVETIDNKFILTKNNLSLKTAKYKVDGKWVSYEKSEELEKKSKKKLK